ncbi:MAG: helix-turn-helix domain-containing protein [Euryarchaeota archaeon]|nr:helix-turn-helix domain-containing protein [Euryarchaeota archaeon]
MKNAVESLRNLGLTEYEARVYTALVKIASGTASDIHIVSGIPRSAVYGALNRLEERGVIETQSSKPMRYRAVPPENALEKLKGNFIAESEDALASLKEIYQTQAATARGEVVWTINGVKNVSDKALEMITGAQQDVIFAASYPSFREIAGTYPVFENLKDAIIDKIGEGVTVRMTGSFDKKFERIAKGFRGAEIRISPVDKPNAGGGILIIDGREVLIVIVSENVNTGMKDLVAICADGVGVVSVFKHFVEAEWGASAPYPV